MSSPSFRKNSVTVKQFEEAMEGTRSPHNKGLHDSHLMAKVRVEKPWSRHWTSTHTEVKTRVHDLEGLLTDLTSRIGELLKQLSTEERNVTVLEELLGKDPFLSSGMSGDMTGVESLKAKCTVAKTYAEKVNEEMNQTDIRRTMFGTNIDVLKNTVIGVLNRKMRDTGDSIEKYKLAKWIKQLQNIEVMESLVRELHHNQTIEDKLIVMLREIRETKNVLYRSLGTSTIQLKDGFKIHTAVLNETIPLADLVPKSSMPCDDDDDDNDDDIAVLIQMHMH
ncbi:hypothetical protein ScPMuIL_013474 [Solemya velum]